MPLQSVFGFRIFNIKIKNKRIFCSDIESAFSLFIQLFGKMKCFERYN